MGLGEREVWKAARAAAAHTLLFTFTVVVVLKLCPFSSWSWWLVFSPLWLFHAVVRRGRFSIPSASHLDGCPFPWDPFHSVVAMPLLIAFEVLLCVYLESSYVNQVAAVNLKIVFMPVFLWMTIIIIENFSSPGLEWDARTQMFDHAIIAVSMPFILGATVCLCLMINGDTIIVNFWGPILLSSYGQLWAFVISLSKMRTRDHYKKSKKGSSSSEAADCLNQSSASVVPVEEAQNLVRVCIGGHVVMVLVVGFQILLCMYLQGTPARAREIPIPIVFSPLFLLQGVGVLFSISQLVERIVVLLLHNEAGNGRYLKLSSRVCDYLEFLCHGSRFLGWWLIDDSREADARRLHECESGCDTFCGGPPDLVKKMTKKDLVEEVCALQAAINQQIQLTGSSQLEYEQLQYEKVLCKICFQRNIGVVLLPCRHRILCIICCKKCTNCPICRVSIAKRVCLSYV